MPATLISAIGRGRKDDTGQAYTKTEYAIADFTSTPTPFFVHAWMEYSDQLAQAKSENIDTVHLIGTATSTWAALLEEYQNDDVALWETIEELCGEQDSAGVSSEDLIPVGKILSEKWNRTVTCHVLCHQQVDDESADQIVAALLDLFPLSQSDQSLIIDTTHGIRTLPLLAHSTVQLAEALSPGISIRTRFIYGEYLGGKARGIVFNSLLENHGLAQALSLFENSLDAAPLAEKIESVYPALAKSLRQLSLCLHANIFSQLDERIRQLRNSISHLNTKIKPSYRDLLIQRLQQFCAQLDKPTLRERLLALAALRAERHQYGMAILALSEAATALACNEKTSDEFEKTKELGNVFRRALSQENKGQWDRLFQHRNRIAHGANLSTSKNTITEQNIEQAYQKHALFLKKLIKEY